MYSSFKYYVKSLLYFAKKSISSQSQLNFKFACNRCFFLLFVRVRVFRTTYFFSTFFLSLALPIERLKNLTSQYERKQITLIEHIEGLSLHTTKIIQLELKRSTSVFNQPLPLSYVFLFQPRNLFIMRIFGNIFLNLRKIWILICEKLTIF